MPVLVEVTMFAGGSASTMAALHRAMADRIRISAAGRDPDSVLVVINESPPSHWSVGGVPQDHVDVGFDIEV